MLAAGEHTGFLGPVVALLVAAGIIGYLSVRLRVVPIVGFLLAGVLIGPHQLGLIDNTVTVDAAAEIGVMLLLFTIGVEFSLERLASIKRFVLLGGGVQVLVTTAITSAAVLAFISDWRTAVFTGFLVALSSTAIVLKVLSATGRTTRTVGQASMGTLIFQDLAVVGMVLLVPLLGAEPGEGGLVRLLRALITAVLVLAVVLIVARKVMPPLLELVARTCSPEVFLLTVVAIGLGTAYLTSLAGVSVALGAFLAGVVVSESRHSSHALGEVLPLQIIFSAVFFVSIGMLLDLAVLVRLWWLIPLLALVVVLIKLIGSFVALAFVGIGAPTALAGSLLLAQIGEFSFVLERAGSEAGLSPAGLGEDGRQVLIAVTVILMVITPALSAAGDRLAGVLSARSRRATTGREQVGDGTGVEPDGHVVVSGWGPVADRVAGAVAERGLSVAVTTLSPDLAAEAESRGHRVVRGDPIKENVLAEAGLRSASLVVICENDIDESGHIAAVLRRLVPDVPIVLRPRGSTAPDPPVAMEADHIVDSARVVGAELTAVVLRRLCMLEPDRAYPDPTVLIDFVPQDGDGCPHTSEIRPVLPSAAGCIDCLRAGRSDWVHLRICLSCGKVGCCDSSPERHAAQHAATVEHPIAASAEPEETWAWCYLDRTRLRRRST